MRVEHIEIVVTLSGVWVGKRAVHTMVDGIWMTSVGNDESTRDTYCTFSPVSRYI